MGAFLIYRKTNQFRHIVRKYGVAKDVKLTLVKNDKDRVRVLYMKARLSMATLSHP